ncbi:MAG: sigma-70 family RNA polymerase sigma factor [Firmicutes bacterium]|nr:sigma-70 family RNA polymerase sigma factor [Bacillota bacterium]
MNFNEIYTENYTKLLRQAAFLLGDKTAAEDMVQEAFIRLNKTGLSTIETPSAWLTRVVNNLCYSYMRSEGSRRRREEKVGRQSVEEHSAEQVVLNKEDKNLTHQALSKLQPRDRMVLLLKFSGYKYHEIASALNINKSSVGTILSRARDRFKKEYQQLGR